MAKTPAMSPSDMPPGELLEALPQSRKDDARALMDIMAELTAESPVVWAGRIVGYGQYRYRYDSGHKGVAPLVSFAAGRSRLAIYLIGYSVIVISSNCRVSERSLAATPVCM
jgi:hypothetical protein